MSVLDIGYNSTAVDRHRECFIKYISSKPVKRLESYKLKKDTSEKPCKLLLPVSGGVSSVVLLQVLDRLIERQLTKRGRTTYEILILMVENPLSDANRRIAQYYEAIKKTFSSYSFALLSLSTVFELDHGIYDDYSGLSSFDQSNPQETLEHIVSSAGTASSRADLLDTLLTRLIVIFSKINKCDAVLWGHSNSRLAAKSLSAVAEGRGGSLPFQILDGLSPHGVNFYYPLRDLFKPELATYSNVIPETFSDLLVPDCSKQPVSVRDTSISDLLASYIDSQGEKYPSIMANVVRTASKLQVPVSRTGSSKCALCCMPILEKDELRNQADTGDDVPRLCFGCQRSTHEMQS